MVEWYTRTTQNRLPQGMEVQILSPAPMIYLYAFLIFTQILFCIIVILFFISAVIAQFTTDAPFVPIPRGIENDIINALALSNTSILYDLGCGDARVLTEAVRKYPYIQAIGIEKGFIPFVFAKWRTRNNPTITIILGDIFTASISDATHIFTYLYPQVVEKLMPKISTECLPGTRIVSCDFEAKNRTPIEIIPLKKTVAGRGEKLIIYSV